MSGGTQPLFTNVNPVPLWVSQGNASVVSSFTNVSASTITASTITAGKVTAGNGVFAVNQVGLIYTSSFSGTAPTNASTLIANVTGSGLYTVNLGITTSGINGGAVGGSFVVGQNATTPGYLYGFPIAYTNNAGIYSIEITQNNGGSGPIEVYFANNGGLNNVPYNGTYTRIGF